MPQSSIIDTFEFPNNHPNLYPIMRGTSLLFPLLLLCFLFQNLDAQTARQRSVQVSATVQESPARIIFSWPSDNTASGYTVYKKALSSTDWGSPVATLPSSSVSYVDTDVAIGQGYEYAFYKKEFDNVVTSVCVPSGATLRFDITDMYDIGLCCSFCFGGYTIDGCNQNFATGDNFGSFDTHTFTVCGESPCTEITITITPDMFPNSTSWTLTDIGTGMELANSGGVGTFISERPKYGYIYAGIKVPALESRGSILLVEESSISDALSAEISQLRTDCILDGWKVKQLTVNANTPVTSVRNSIQQIWQNTPDLTAVYLLGHVPVPFSGDIFPDTHFEHQGAWAADTYYGEMNGNWTDNSVDRTTAFFEHNHNVPGDGKFDQDAIPTKMELQVGRVDLSNLPAFSLNEIELTRNYLIKAHNFKTGAVNFERRALVDDNFMQQFAAPAASGFRNFAPMFGATNIDEIDFLTNLSNSSYLWAYGCGSGSHISCEGVATTQEIASSNLRNVFTMLFGSQFGDWHYENNILRAPLAQGSTLTNCWAGSPAWTFHHMAMGYPIGYSALRTMNADINDYLPGPQLVHLGLMGDPTLRLHPVQSASVYSVDTENNQNTISWNPPPGEDYVGFYVYKSETLNGDYNRISNEIVTENSFTDTNPIVGNNVYMVRTVKLESSGSGTYYNLGLGSVDSIDFVVNTEEFEVNHVSVFPNPSQGQIQINWNEQHHSKVTLQIHDVSGKLVHVIEFDTNQNQSHVNLEALPSGIYMLSLIGDDFNHFEKLVIE